MFSQVSVCHSVQRWVPMTINHDALDITVQDLQTSDLGSAGDIW